MGMLWTFISTLVTAHGLFHVMGLSPYLTARAAYLPFIIWTGLHFIAMACYFAYLAHQEVEPQNEEDGW